MVVTTIRSHTCDLRTPFLVFFDLLLLQQKNKNKTKQNKQTKKPKPKQNKKPPTKQTNKRETSPFSILLKKKKKKNRPKNKNTNCLPLSHVAHKNMCPLPLVTLSPLMPVKPSICFAELLWIPGGAAQTHHCVPDGYYLHVIILEFRVVQ